MRNVHINYDAVSGHYLIAFMENQTIKGKRSTGNYHEIGSIVSNWIINGWIEE